MVLRYADRGIPLNSRHIREAFQAFIGTHCVPVEYRVCDSGIKYQVRDLFVNLERDMLIKQKELPFCFSNIQ